jgi:hypothetical protein
MQDRSRREVDNEMIYRVESSLVFCHGLVSASHLNGKLGVVRDFTLTDAGHPRLTVEFEQKGVK